LSLKGGFLYWMETVDSLIPILISRSSKETTIDFDYVSTLNEFADFKFLKENMPFNYTVSLFKGVTNKKEVFIAKLIFQFAHIMKPIVDIRMFRKNEAVELASFMSMPRRLFKPTDIDVLLFPGTPMSSVEINELLKKWKTQI
jgi:hypothetical protein